jgi:acetylornithine deacetylase
MSVTTAPPFSLPAGAIDSERAIATLREAIGRGSVTGNEANFVGLLAEILPTVGVSGVTIRDFLPGRPNIWGVRKGSGCGKRLLILGHTDVVHAHGWRERWAGTPREDPFGAAIIDEAIWGRGTADLKAGICMVIEALRALDRAGATLAGEVVLAFVGDEESGERGTGVSAGMKALVPLISCGELPKPDLAIYVEPTGLDVFSAQMGFFIADIEVIGRTAYFGVPELGVDALKATHAILAALWSHSAELAKRGKHKLIGSSFLLVTSIEGGGLIAVPERCRLSLIRKLRPGEDLLMARDELEAAVVAAVNDPQVRVTFTYPAGRDHTTGGTATEIDPQSEAIQLLAAAIKHRRPDRGRILGAPFWSEAPFLVNLGIPTVYFAPGDISCCHTLEERVPIAEYISGIAAMADFIARYCGVAQK